MTHTMEKGKHTPEVWRVDSVGPRNRPLISAGDKPIAELSIAWGNNADANARLIAAAPVLKDELSKLVAAARAVVAAWESGDLAGAVNALDAAADDAEATIAAAEGKV